MKKKLIAGLAVPALVLGGAGIASAQSEGPADVYESEGVDEALADAPGDPDGCELPGGPGRLRGHRNGAFGPRFGGLVAPHVAEALGLDVHSLREELEAGKTLAEIAAEQGVDLDALIDDIVARAEAKAAESDRPWADEFDAEALRERLTEAANRVVELRPNPGRDLLSALGLDRAELRERLAAGETLAEIAAEQGVDLDALIDTAVADALAWVDGHGFPGKLRR